MRSRQASAFEKKPAYRSPRASSIAPVSVARSSTCVAPSRRAYQSASARTRRPSASVLMISIVLPFAARTMSPGRKASPPGMFSAAASTATARTGRPRAAIAPMPCSVPAPPAMSPFIASMPLAGLMEMPPVSKVIDLPTSPSTRPALVGCGGWQAVVRPHRRRSAEAGELMRRRGARGPQRVAVDLFALADACRQEPSAVVAEQESLAAVAAQLARAREAGEAIVDAVERLRDRDGVRVGVRLARSDDGDLDPHDRGDASG